MRMKKKTNSYILKLFKTVLFALTLLVLTPVNFILAQEGTDSVPETAEKISPSLKISSIKNSDETRTLVAVFSYKDKETKTSYDVKGVSITFFVGTDSLINLGTSITDENGKAICNIKPDFVFPKNEEGFIHFTNEFEGNDLMEAASGEIDVKDLSISLSLEEIDSVKTVTVKVEQIMANDERVPLNEVEMQIFVARMFSHLPVGAITLAEGEGTLEFPNDLPGDTDGNLVVIAKFEEHEEFGTVMKSDTIAWGIKTAHYNAYSPRSLWTQVAPVWMIITLSIMLLGVWGHYVYVIIQLVLLKKGQKKVVV